jgi:uncharacterized protein YbaP (TraB family)
MNTPRLRYRSHSILLALGIAAALAASAVLLVAAERNFLWKAAKGDGSIYLVGSVHMLTKDYYPLNQALEAAFKDSDLLVEEVDLGELLAPEMQFKMLMRGMLPTDQSLDRVLSQETFALVNRRVSRLGMPIEPLRRFKPWMLALTLAAVEWQQAGFDPTLGLDRHFYDRARSEQKSIQALETVDFQISRFDELTMEEQDRMLAATVRQLDTQKAAVARLADAWKAGDTRTIEQLVLEDFKQEPRLYERLLVERNRTWLAQIEALFDRPGRAFVVVGAAHLVGSDGLLAMLTARGFTVEQM